MSGSFFLIAIIHCRISGLTGAIGFIWLASVSANVVSLLVGTIYVKKDTWVVCEDNTSFKVVTLCNGCDAKILPTLIPLNGARGS